MDGRIITCRSIGVYDHALTRGNKYIVKNEDGDKYRIIGNHEKGVWISKAYFIEGNIEMPYLETWKFDDDPKEFDLVEVTLTFSDGSERWSLVTTPQKLVNHFKKEKELPGFNIKHLIIMKTMNHDNIEKTLKYLEANDELTEASKALER
ncbi:MULTISPECIES: hypothetical protein [Paenibacillus]|uniref:hypothetical protein n=1 Tax=Paenibacillus TaxID=44249 RepID=UPI000382A99B|nr:MULTISPECIES: hypothetical protein [Paenibacillus]KKD52992.1 hypothetical protein C400_21555 [Paenibacillus sp. ICGEB2008]NMP11255.1 hypothetical protein [Paenibacillus polymyxa]UNL93280.1 hypothetical protein CPY53_06705 [Paenibacillus polymyxa]